MFVHIMVQPIFKLPIQLPIYVIGDINSSIKNFFVSLELFACLISVQQLVDNNYEVYFIMMVVLCKIKCRERYSRRDLKLDDCFLYTFPFLILFH